MEDFSKETKRITIFGYNGEETFDCDIMMADLIEALNYAGFYTEYCCSGHKEDAHISFYIKFEVLSNEKQKALEEIINSTDDVFFVRETEISPCTEYGRHYVQLRNNPTEEELRLAFKLVYGTENPPQHVINRDVYSYIILNHNIRKDYDNLEIAFDEDGIRDCYNATINFINKVYKDNLARVQRSIEQLTEKVREYIMENNIHL